MAKQRKAKRRNGAKRMVMQPQFRQRRGPSRQDRVNGKGGANTRKWV